MRFNSRPLIAAIKAAMPLPPYVPGGGSRRTWLRPPLVTDKVLGGVRLQDFVKVLPSQKYDPDELIEIAERYVAKFIVGQLDHDDEQPWTPCDWVRANLILPDDVQRWLFPTKASASVKNDVWRHFTTLLWIASNCSGTLRVGPGVLVYSTGGYSVGVEGGYVVSRLATLRVPVEHVDFEPYLKHSPTGWESHSHVLAWNRVLRQASHHPDACVLTEALLILHARMPDKQKLIRAMYPPSEGKRAPINKMLRMADGLLEHPDPYNRMKKFLVPYWMPLQSFNAIFKKPPGQPPLVLVAAWKDRLASHFGLEDYKADRSLSSRSARKPKGD